MSVPGISTGRALDLSNWQGAVPQDWFERRLAEGIDRLILGTQDLAVTRVQLRNAREAGFQDIQFYIWVRFEGVPNSWGVIKRFITYWMLEGTVWLDCEETIDVNVDPLPRIRWAKKVFRDWRVGIYTRRQWWIESGLGRNFGSLPLWDADYDGISDLDAGWVKYGGWETRAMKQYSANVSLDGVTVDLNVF